MQTETPTPTHTNEPGTRPAPTPRQVHKPSDAELEQRFRYHPPKTDSRREKHEEVTELMLATAKRLRDICPGGRNLSIALTDCENVRMRANAALACDSPDEN